MSHISCVYKTSAKYLKHMASEQFANIEPKNLTELRWLLLRNKVLYFLWMFGRKNESHLFAEIEKGETKLVHDAEYGIIRQTHVMNIEVRYIDPHGDEWVLQEDRQEWHNKLDMHGKKRVDRRNHAYVSEKVELSELNPNGSIQEDKALARALFEELDGVQRFERVISLGIKTMIKESSSYPGLKTKFIVHLYRVHLPQSEWRQEYVEKGKEKSTHFLWARVE